MPALTLHFHPDWPFGDGLVIEAMAQDGAYRSQFETGTSNGGLFAHPGGLRWAWESRLFAGRYDDRPAADRPVYGAWNRSDDPYGGSPRFGSAYVRLTEEAAARATYCFPDSVFDPEEYGGPERLTDLVALADERAADPEWDRLDDYVEAQAHGGVRFDRDVAAVVLDPAHADGPVHVAAERLGCPVELHPGYRVDTARLSAAYRGEEPYRLAVELGVELTPDVVAAAARSGRHDPQTVKRVWHLLARFGRHWA